MARVVNKQQASLLYKLIDVVLLLSNITRRGRRRTRSKKRKKERRWTRLPWTHFKRLEGKGSRGRVGPPTSREREYTRVCDLPVLSSLAAATMILTTSTTNHDIDIALTWELLEADRKVVQVTCDEYSSSIRRSFNASKKMQVNAITTANTATATDGQVCMKDIALFREQSRIFLDDADVYRKKTVAESQV